MYIKYVFTINNTVIKLLKQYCNLHDKIRRLQIIAAVSTDNLPGKLFLRLIASEEHGKTKLSVHVHAMNKKVSENSAW
jgi:hypothetical protein